MKTQSIRSKARYKLPFERSVGLYVRSIWTACVYRA